MPIPPAAEPSQTTTEVRGIKAISLTAAQQVRLPKPKRATPTGRSVCRRTVITERASGMARLVPEAVLTAPAFITTETEAVTELPRKHFLAGTH